MSWSVNMMGTRERVLAGTVSELDRCAKNYEGKEEQKDVLAAKDIIVSAINEMNLAADSYATEGYSINVSANGHRSSGGVNVSIQVSKIKLVI